MPVVLARLQEPLALVALLPQAQCDFAGRISQAELGARVAS
jgi:hypothetical protein